MNRADIEKEFKARYGDYVHGQCIMLDFAEHIAKLSIEEAKNIKISEKDNEILRITRLLVASEIERDSLLEAISGLDRVLMNTQSDRDEIRLENRALLARLDYYAANWVRVDDPEKEIFNLPKSEE